MVAIRAALHDAERRLAAVPGQPRQDAELLMAAALGVSVGALHLSHLDDATPPAFADFLTRRLAREPIAYITGRIGFWTIELEIGPGALIPRADSEALIEAAVLHFAGTSPARILDLGTGPGTLLLAALDQWPTARGVGIDASTAALELARRNAAQLGLADRTDLRTGDWGAGLDELFDLVLCNPPYVRDDAALIPDVTGWEPDIALFGGADGLDAYRILAGHLPRLVAPGGVACLEVGAGQAAAVRALMADGPFTITSRSDLRSIERCLVLELTELAR